MNTPILDFLKAYENSSTSRLHMPGHKGAPYLGMEALDITEIMGADELYSPHGIIGQSEVNATALFNTGATLYSTEGSSHAIRSMIILAKQHYFHGGGRPMILAARNAHKSFIYALAICDCDVQWLYPSPGAENSAAACQPTAQSLKEILLEDEKAGTMPFAVYVTSPDYLGYRADIGAMAKVCGEFNLPLLVDNAHGAYQHFIKPKCHPMDLGASMCCDSAHKTLPVLTGGAYLHLAKGTITAEDARTAMELTGTTSPSYIIMASLDQCNARLAGDYPRRLAETIELLEQWKREQRGFGIPILDTEPLKIVVNAGAMGFTGVELAQKLRENKVEPEFADGEYLVAMISPDNTPLDLQRTALALKSAKDEKRKALESKSLQLRPLPQRMSLRQAVFAPSEKVPVEKAVGRICGAPTVSCPPAIPIAVSGEELTEDILPVFKAYGIEEITVIK